jgi:protein tyrosine phosphatase (PTP) superfamily phosphohydrolase (DUF442 family)
MRRRIATIGLAALGAVVAVGALAYWRVHSFNLREVLPGEIYRVAQPDVDDIEQATRSIGLRTIVNLRGPNPKNAWYREEVDVTKRLDVGLVSLRFETFDWPPRIETLQLVETIDHAPRPILLHCHTGLDRSGWAAGVVRLLHGDSIDEARAELSRPGGHLCNRDTCALHRFFALYESWLAATGRAHSPEAFREWLSDAYYPPPYGVAITARGELPRSSRPGAPLSLRVGVTNTSGTDWVTTSDTRSGIRLGARVLGPFDTAPPDPVEIFRAPRTHARDLYRERRSNDVWKPGATRVLDVVFAAPAEPGLYFVQVDMVDELVHWFSDLGDAGLIVPLVVEPAGAELRIQN